MREPETQAPLRYLNVHNPDVKANLCIHNAKIAMGQAGTSKEDWDRLEREIMREYILSDYTPHYRYPFFLQINLPEVRTMWDEYLREIRHPVEAAPSDQDRMDFERRVARMVTGGGTG